MRYYNKLLILAIIVSVFNGCSSSSSTDDKTTQPTTIESKSLEPSGWYMRVIVQATDENGKTYIHNSAGVFGELDESLDTLDKHDIPSQGKAILQVRFINSDFNNSKQYYSDYRKYNNDTYIGTWDIIVINSDKDTNLSNASLVLDIENIKNIYRKENQRYEEVISDDTTLRDSLHIIDIDNQQVYSYDELKNANLDMDNKNLRKFRIVLGKVTQDDMKSFVVKSMKSLYNAKVVIHTSDKFGLPPQL